jgi:rhamnogalacturonan endolyase
VAALLVLSVAPGIVPATWQAESLDRGVVALRQGDDRAFVGWRLLATDPKGIAFNLYRQAGDGPSLRLNDSPLTGGTCFEDAGVDFSQPVAYFVRLVADGCEINEAPGRPFVSRAPRAATGRPAPGEP